MYILIGTMRVFITLGLYVTYMYASMHTCMRMVMCVIGEHCCCPCFRFCSITVEQLAMCAIIYLLHTRLVKALESLRSKVNTTKRLKDNI